MLSAGLSILLAALALLVNHPWLTALDTSAEVWLAAHRPAGLRTAAEWVFGAIGQPLVFATAVLTCGVVFARRTRSVIPGALLVAAVGVTVVLEEGLKALVGRTSLAVAGLQDPVEIRVYGPVLRFLHSFPSGHVAAIAVFIGVVAVVLGTGRGLVDKMKLWALAGFGVLFVAVLAVFVRAHTVTDVIGGMLLGSAVVAASAAVLPRTIPARRGMLSPYVGHLPAPRTRQLAPAIPRAPDARC
ncbi:phosphatase PAP2 family protein [Mycolicibacterium sp.]|uniref:phosphatase PAP2 family protein n=1 Tax=Mycolicibacterium sp. TaxID=2320850 RepID=UPI0028ADB942|nr:phosphatase PAP2 family protein [Mycolicibacterium sp.]